MRRRDPIKKVIRKDGTTRWRFTIDVGKKPDGKRDQRTHTYDTFTEAKNERAKIVAGLAMGTYVRPGKKSLGEHLDEWLAGRRGLKLGTRNSYRDSLKPVRDRYESTPLQDLTKAHVDQLVTDMLASGRRVGARRGTGLSPSTVARTLKLLKAALDDALRQGLIVRNVAALVEPPRLTGHTVTTWIAEEAAAFLAYVDGHRLSAAWQLSMYGLRRGEVLGLRWCDVDLIEGTLTVAVERVVSDGQVYEDEPKSERGKRTLPLDEGLTTSLRALKSRQAKERLKAGTAYADPCPDCCQRHIVVDELGDPMHPEGYSDRFETLVKRCGLPRIRLHDTRHTCGTLMHLRGVPGVVIAAWLGHAKADFTMRTYVHSQDPALAEAGKVLRAALSA